MMKLFIITLLTGIILLNGCSILKKSSQGDPDVLLKDEFNTGAPVAVLDFSVRGPSASDGLGRVMADRLSEKMFLSGSLKTIERSRVNEAVKYLSIRTLDELSQDDLQKLGMRLKADYIVLGNITSSRQNDLPGDKVNSSISVSIRIISVLNSDIVGVINYSEGYDGSIHDKMEEVISRVVNKLSSR